MHEEPSGPTAARVTCVVNAHREGHLVHATIASVRRACRAAAESGIGAEIVVVLDRGDAYTEEVVDEALAGEGRCEKVSYGDLALSRNHAVRDATTEFVAFLDGDDLWGPSWLGDACLMLALAENEIVVHPEYNVYFGGPTSHVFRHVGSESCRFVHDSLMRENYWTALSCARRTTYLTHPYTENTLKDGFGYEDWTWNVQTIEAGVVHAVAPATAHFIRRGKTEPSLLDMTNSTRSLPRIHRAYRAGRARALASAEVTA